MKFRSDDCAHDPSECRVTAVSRIQEPLIEWAPIYDGNGVQTNADPNIFIVVLTCSTCGLEWQQQQKADNPQPIEPMQ